MLLRAWRGLPVRIARRTTNPIESTFATVRHPTTRAKNCLSRATFLSLASKLVQEAEKSWRRIRGVECIPELMCGVLFEDGIPVQDNPPEHELAPFGLSI